MRKLTYFVACSLDGFIGDPSGDASAMFAYLDEEFIGYLAAEHPDTLSAPGRKALGIDGLPLKRFDTVLQGRASYEVGLREGVTSPYAHLREYVASRSITESPDPHVEIVSGDLVAKVRELKAEDSPFDIYLCGGSTVAGELLDEIDELVVKTYPMVYGSGMPMFAAEVSLTEFTLGEVRTFGNGALVRTYRRKR
ncbi:dihydrofolate reductase family protein [Streptomyces sp. NPDC093094]|uniref:dihydrofolate reductase family protein n=1 Tax=Streptomyces sp. NPDC093094 TaxID=3366026 RepID=UPI0038041D05